ncbi:MAG: pyridoxal phosphate-dependent aminotransferase [Deltaproteobacteria bacterium]|nr:pyridoxal phosphate-dependent aminotransferase [Deltaproteobacteria bacterium]
MTMERARRLQQLPPYLFAELDRLKAEQVRKGVDVISLGISDPDLPTPPHIVERLKAAAEDAANHRYPSYEGLREFREAVARWYRQRFGVDLDPETEVFALIGSKEGIAHFPLAFLNPGDSALVPSPGYPVYHAGTVFAGATPHTVPLRPAQGFLPDLGAIPEVAARQAKLLFLNYPNNPTAAVAEVAFFEQVVAYAQAHHFIVAHDAAYSEIAFDGYRPASFLQARGAKEVGIEFHSLSKTYNMTGWRVGFAVGHPELIAALGQVKTNVDSGVFQAVQEAGIAALDGDQGCVEEMRRTYQERRDLLLQGLREVGLKAEVPRASFYVWAEVPPGYTSAKLTTHLLLNAGIAVTPGNGFGPEGEGFVRMALTVDRARIAETVERMRKVGF